MFSIFSIVLAVTIAIMEIKYKTYNINNVSNKPVATKKKQNNE